MLKKRIVTLLRSLVLGRAGRARRESGTAASILILPGYARFGGTRTFFEVLAAQLRADAHNVRVLLEEPQRDEAMLSLLDAQGIVVEKREDWTPARAQEGRPLAFLGEALAVQRLLRKHPADLVIVTGLHNGGLYLCGLPLPVLYVNHALPQEDLEDYEVRLLRASLAREAQLWAVSEHARKVLAERWELGKAVDRVTVIHNSGGVLRESAKREEPPMVLTVGHFEWSKGSELWVELVERLRAAGSKARFCWIGGGIADNTAFEQARARLEPLGGVEMRAHEKDVLPFYDRASLYLQPSNYENLPYAVLDALRSHLPCVVSDVGGLPELVRDGEQGRVVPRQDLDGFVEAVDTLLKDAVLRQRCGEAAATHYEASFSPQHWQGQVRSLVGRMLA